MGLFLFHLPAEPSPWSVAHARAVQGQEQPRLSLGTAVNYPISELTNCPVAAREPATLTPPFSLQAHAGCECGLVQSLLQQLSHRTAGWAVGMPFQGNEGACGAGIGALCTGAAACLWPLPGSVGDCSAGFPQGGAGGVRDAAQ